MSLPHTEEVRPISDGVVVAGKYLGLEQVDDKVPAITLVDALFGFKVSHVTPGMCLIIDASY